MDIEVFRAEIVQFRNKTLDFEPKMTDFEYKCSMLVNKQILDQKPKILKRNVLFEPKMTQF